MAFLIAFPLLLAWALIPAGAKPGREPAGAAAAAPARDAVRRAAKAPGAAAAPTTRPRPATPRPTTSTGPTATTKARPEATAAPTSTARSSGPQTTAERLARDLFQRVNAERRARGLAGLDWDNDLARMAAEWSTRMARTGDFSHRDLGAAGGLPGIGRFSALGENIAWVEGYPNMGYQLHFGWMRSAGHRANQLQPGFDAVGIAVVCDGGRAWATQNFGRLDSSRAPPMTSATPSEDPIVATRTDGVHC
ncbi:MAG TPA: CAP domain-containing protein [Actinomycetota bacterium]|nr:CAP domain-containing protein [Actinomycetota bacterium]